MSYIGQRPVVGRYIKLDQISSGFNGSNTGFSMTAGSQAVFPGTARNLLLSLGGVIQEPDTDFTISGSTLTFTTPPVANTTFFGVIYGDMQATGTPSDGTVLPASIASSGNFSFPEVTVTGDVNIADSIIHSGDTDTKIRFPAANTVSVETGGAETFRADGSQRLLVGTSTARGIGGAAGRKIQVEGGTVNGLSITKNSADNQPVFLSLGKSRSASVGGTTIVQDNDELGQIQFCGADGNDLITRAASITAEVDGTPGADDMPGRLVFSTTADGAASPTTRLTIDSAGKATFTGGLSVDGATVFNEAGADVDFRIEGDTEANLFYVDAGNDRVGINTNSPLGHLGIAAAAGTSGTTASAGYDEFVIEGGNEAIGMCFLSPAANNCTQRIAFGDSNNNKSGLIAYEHGNDAFAFDTGGSERMRIDSTGRLLIGSTSALSHGGIESHLQVLGTGTDDSSITLSRFSNNVHSPYIAFAKSRNGSVGGNTVVQSGDSIGRMTFFGNDGTDGNTPAAEIDVEVDGTPGSNDMPGRIVFRTTSDGASSVTERMRVDSSGDITVNFDGSSQTGQFKIADGSASSPGLTFWADGSNDTGIFRSGANTLNFSTAGSERMRIDSSGDVLFYGTIRNDNVSSALNISGGNGADSSANIILNGSSGSPANVIQFRTGTTERMRIANDGKVGIGDSTPNYELQVNDPSGTVSVVQLTNTTTGAGAGDGLLMYITGNDTIISNEEAGYMRFQTSGLERMRIDSSGNVGIGTSSPDTKLHLEASNNGVTAMTSANNRLRFTDTDTTVTTNQPTGVIEFESRDSGNEGIQAYIACKGSNTGQGSLHFATGKEASSTLAERVIIDQSGNVGIGTTSPACGLHIDSPSDAAITQILDTDNAAVKLVFRNNTETGNNMQIGADGSNLVALTGATERMRIDSSGHVLIGTTTTALTTSSFGIALLNNGAALFYRSNGSGVSTVKIGGNAGEARIDGAGNIINTNNSYGQISDETLKQDIVDAASQWNDIKNIKVRKFRFKDNPTGNLQIGVVAQELETVSAGLVQEDDEGIKSVKYSVLYMKAVKCLQEAIAKIETLETKVAALEAA